MDKVGLIVGLVLGVVGLYRIDTILYKGLNYFGKYVFFVIFNAAILYLFWYFYKRFEGRLKIIFPLMFGILIFAIGVKIA